MKRIEANSINVFFVESLFGQESMFVLYIVLRGGRKLENSILNRDLMFYGGESPYVFR